MECPICFAEFNSTERVPLKAFCKCGKTLCLVCIESMIQNNAVCPWDKTRWSGRNLMSKFYNNTPDNYLTTLQTQMSEAECVVATHNVSELGSGELRSDYLHQLQQQSLRFHAEREDQLRKDTLMALALQKEANDKLLQLQRIELEDQKLATLLAQQNNSQVKSQPVKKNTILYSLQRQKSIADMTTSNSACSSSSSGSTNSHCSPGLTGTTSAPGSTDTELSPLSVQAAEHHPSDSQGSQESEEDGGHLSPVLIRRGRDAHKPLSCSNSSSGSSNGNDSGSSKSTHHFSAADGSTPTRESASVRVTVGSVLAARDRVNSALSNPFLGDCSNNNGLDGLFGAVRSSGRGGDSSNSSTSGVRESDSAGKPWLSKDRLGGGSRNDVLTLSSSGNGPAAPDVDKHKVLGKRPCSAVAMGGGSGTASRIQSTAAGSGDWHCVACTFLNNCFLTKCEVCDAEKR